MDTLSMRKEIFGLIHDTNSGTGILSHWAYEIDKTIEKGEVYTPKRLAELSAAIKRENKKIRDIVDYVYSEAKKKGLMDEK